MMSLSVKTRTRSTGRQLRLLVDYMATHPRLARGDFNGPQGRRHETRQWEELRAVLSEYGPDKSIEQWKASWRDIRRKARTEAAALATDNVVEISTLSDINKKILQIMDGTYSMQDGEESGTLSAVVAFEEVSTESMTSEDGTTIEEHPVKQEALESSILSPSPNDDDEPPPPKRIFVSKHQKLYIQKPHSYRQCSPQQLSPPSQVSPQRPLSPQPTHSPQKPLSSQPSQPDPLTLNETLPVTFSIDSQDQEQRVFERITKEFVDIERRRLDLQEAQEKNMHERELLRLKVESERVEVDREVAKALQKVSDIAANLLSRLKS